MPLYPITTGAFQLGIFLLWMDTISSVIINRSCWLQLACLICLEIILCLYSARVFTFTPNTVPKFPALFSIRYHHFVPGLTVRIFIHVLLVCFEAAVLPILCYASFVTFDLGTLCNYSLFQFASIRFSLVQLGSILSLVRFIHFVLYSHTHSFLSLDVR